MIIGLLLSCGKNTSKEGFDVELAKNIPPITIPKDDTKVKRDIYSFFTNLTAKKYGVTLALKEKYTGVTIDKNTAKLVVDSTASPGGVTVVASRPTSNDYLGGRAESRVVLQD